MKQILLSFAVIAGLLFIGCEDSDKDNEWEWEDETKERLTEVIAHRGASGYKLENSMAAFNEAVKQGSDHVELDIWRTTDDSLIVFHDRDTERLTAQKLIVPQSTYAQLRVLRLSNGEQIPTLREVLAVLPDTVGVFVEIKCCWEPGQTGQVFPMLTQILKAADIVERSTIISFNPANAADVEKNIPDRPFYLLSYKKESADLIIGNAAKAKCDGINISYLAINQEVVSLARKNDLKVYVWGVNKVDVANQMLGLKVDGITTDYPDEIINAVKR